MDSPFDNWYNKDFKELAILPIHEHKCYRMQCCDLLNSEWPKQTKTRLRTLDRSCKYFPTSFVLVFGDLGSGNEKVVGHCRVSNMLGKDYGCKIESMIIAKEYRGNGWGKYLMDKMEEFAKAKGKKTIYLGTIDKEGFYEKCGYQKHGNSNVFSGAISKCTSVLEPTKCENSNINATPPLPPPLPPPPNVPHRMIRMKKKLYHDDEFQRTDREFKWIGNERIKQLSKMFEEKFFP